MISWPGADHLRDEIEGDHHERARSGEYPHRGLVEAERGDVGEGELAEVAQALGEEEGHDRPADQEADRVDQAVEAAHHHRRRDAEERRRRHVVAGDRQAVLEAGDAAARGVEIGRGLGRAAAHLVMYSVPSTKIANMAIAVQLIGWRCAWPRSGQRQGARGSGRQRRRRQDASGSTGSFEHLLGDLVGEQVELAVGAPHVDAGDDDGEHDHRQADRHADRRHASPSRVARKGLAKATSRMKP